MQYLYWWVYEVVGAKTPGNPQDVALRPPTSDDRLQQCLGMLCHMKLQQWVVSHKAQPQQHRCTNQRGMLRYTSIVTHSFSLNAEPFCHVCVGEFDIVDSGDSWGFIKVWPLLNQGTTYLPNTSLNTNRQMFLVQIQMFSFKKNVLEVTCHGVATWERERIHASMKESIIGSDNGLSGACSAPSHYLNQCWPIAKYTLRNIFLKSFFYWQSKVFIQLTAFENVVCKMAAILSHPQCVNAYFVRLSYNPKRGNICWLTCCYGVVSMGNFAF